MTDLSLIDAVGQAQLVRSGEMTASELVQAAIERIEALNPSTNAVVHERFDAALREAAGSPKTGPFAGVPLLLKDLGAAMKGEPHYMACEFLQKVDHRPDTDSHVVTKFKEAGFLILGRTNVPQFGSAATCESSLYGPCRNPWDLTKTAGGSSGGAAASVASGMVPVAHASDGGGSTRGPASWNGLVGLKPSRGRISAGPSQAEIWGGFATDSVLARTVRDVAASLDALSGWMPGDPYTAPTPPTSFTTAADAPLTRRLRIGVQIGHVAGQPHPDAIAACEAAVKALTALGHTVEDEFPAALLDLDAFMALGGVTGPALARELERWEEVLGHRLTAADVDAGVWQAAELASRTTAVEMLAAQDQLNVFRRSVAGWWEQGWDLLLTPTSPHAALPVGALATNTEDPATSFMANGAVGVYTFPFNATGQPAISVPTFWNSEGLPLGIQLVGRFGGEALLLQASRELELAVPWKERLAPIHASRSTVA